MHPLLLSALSFICGIAVGDFFELSLGGAIVFSTVFFISASCAFCLRNHSAALCLILFSISGIGAAAISERNQSFNKYSGLVGPEHYGRTAEIRGLISESPSFSSFKVSADSIIIDGAKQAYSATVIVLNRTDFREYDYGDYVRVKGMVRENFFSRSGAAFTQSVYSPAWIQNMGPGKINPVTRLALSAGRRIEDVIEATVPKPESLFLKSILLGKRHVLPDEIRHTLSGIGAGHFLSVSGLHAGLVLFFLLTITGLAGLPPKTASLICICGLVLFCLMTGARVPTVRAVVLAVILLAGTVLGRQTDKWSSLALAALFLLASKPEELFSPGFQLSFAAVAGIFYLYPVFSRFWPAGGKCAFARKPVLALASIHLAVIPIIGVNYGYVPAVSPAANLFLIPLLSIIVSTGLSAGIAGIFHMLPAQIINAANWALIRAVLAAAEIFYRAPGLIFFDRIPGYSIILYYTGLLFLPSAVNKYFSRKEIAYAA